MFDFNRMLNSGIADEAYYSKMSFERTVGFIKYIADESKISLDEFLLVVELKEGVFIGDTKDMAREFINAIAKHRFWERESSRKVPA